MRKSEFQVNKCSSSSQNEPSVANQCYGGNGNLLERNSNNLPGDPDVLNYSSSTVDGPYGTYRSNYLKVKMSEPLTASSSFTATLGANVLVVLRLCSKKTDKQALVIGFLQ